jgi:hypothetical protein
MEQLHGETTMTAKHKPPAHLGEIEARLWGKVMREFGIADAPGIALLTQALEAHQLARECREIIDSEGLMVGGKPHPLLVTLRDARKAFGAFMKQLNFDLEPLNDSPGRPPGSK